jgi:hypothetical protein
MFKYAKACIEAHEIIRYSGIVQNDYVELAGLETRYRLNSFPTLNMIAFFAQTLGRETCWLVINHQKLRAVLYIGEWEL